MAADEDMTGPKGPELHATILQCSEDRGKRGNVSQWCENHVLQSPYYAFIGQLVPQPGRSGVREQADQPLPCL